MTSPRYVPPSSVVPYTPAVPGNWSPAPGAVNTALDQLAAALAIPKTGTQSEVNLANQNAPNSTLIACFQVASTKSGVFIVGANLFGQVSAADTGAELDILFKSDVTSISGGSTAGTYATGAFLFRYNGGALSVVGGGADTFISSAIVAIDSATNFTLDCQGTYLKTSASNQIDAVEIQLSSNQGRNYSGLQLTAWMFELP